MMFPVESKFTSRDASSSWPPSAVVPTALEAENIVILSSDATVPERVTVSSDFELLDAFLDRLMK